MCYCSETGIAFRIELATSKYAPEGEFENGVNKGTAVMRRMAAALLGTGFTLVGDSAFSSVECAVQLRKHHGQFSIGMVKTATKMFPK